MKLYTYLSICLVTFGLGCSSGENRETPAKKEATETEKESIVEEKPEKKKIHSVRLKQESWLKGKITRLEDNKLYYYFQNEKGTYRYGFKENTFHYFPRMDSGRGILEDEKYIYALEISEKKDDYSDSYNSFRWNIEDQKFEMVGDKRNPIQFNKLKDKNKKQLEKKFEEIYTSTYFGRNIYKGMQDSRYLSIKNFSFHLDECKCVEAREGYIKYKNKILHKTEKGACGNLSIYNPNNNKFLFIQQFDSVSRIMFIFDYQTEKLFKFDLYRDEISYDLLGYAPNGTSILLAERGETPSFYICSADHLIKNYKCDSAQKIEYDSISELHDKNHLLISKDGVHSIYDSNGVKKGDYYFTENGKILIDKDKKRIEVDHPKDLSLLELLDEEGNVLPATIEDMSSIMEKNLLEKILSNSVAMPPAKKLTLRSGNFWKCKVFQAMTHFAKYFDCLPLSIERNKFL